MAKRLTEKLLVELSRPELHAVIRTAEVVLLEAKMGRTDMTETMQRNLRRAAKKMMTVWRDTGALRKRVDMSTRLRARRAPRQEGS